MPKSLKDEIIKIAKNIGFNRVGVANFNLQKQAKFLKKWLDNKHHGQMKYLEKNQEKRANPRKLFNHLNSIVALQMDYSFLSFKQDVDLLEQSNKAYISLYARGRDYHKLIKQKAKKLITQVQKISPNSLNRIFVDTAPVLEKPISMQAGLGWIGKNTLNINKSAGSFFFLAQIYTSLKLEPDKVYQNNHCKDCKVCMDVCPTNAIIDPFVLDAKSCISYLTIEHKGVIPVKFRKKIGNRIFGCDDCQLFCPWNKFAIKTIQDDFKTRNNFDNIDLLELFSWDRCKFLFKTQGTPIYRLGYQGWLRNISVALGNSKKDDKIVFALKEKLKCVDEVVAIHIRWALDNQLGLCK
jgi:epoxyqueuosine reductase